MTSAVVVGSGPNGLSAAIALAEHGIDVHVLEAAGTLGGGARSSENTVPGLIHDDCSAFHPTGAGSPVMQAMRLEEHGLEWLWPDVDLAHPLDEGRAGILWRDVDRTARRLGSDGPSWRRLFEPLGRDFDALAEDIFRPVLHLPAHPWGMARFGVAALAPAALFVRRWHTAEARALFGGVAAHAFNSLRTPLSSSVGLLLTAAAHAYGWPVAKGGTGAITRAMAGKLTALGGTISTGRTVEDVRELAGADIVMLDTTPRAAVRILGDRLPPRVRRAFTRFRYGPAAFKVDFAIEGDIPWTNELVRRAGTVHVAGEFAQIADAEAKIARHIMPDRPFVLIGQQYLADPSRSVGDLNPIWAYAHVPHGYAGDATEAIIAQVERFAPGFRDRIRHTFKRGARQLAAYNPNYVGGDISAGRNDPRQLIMRPRVALDPYATGVPGVFLCSSASPPGGGVHGMCGHNAALSALRHL